MTNTKTPINEKDINLLKKYIGAGFYLLPIVPNEKKPITENGLHDASNDWSQIEKWIEQYHNCNWGLRCGKDSGIVVVDVDRKNDGDISLKELVKDKEEFATYVVGTPSSGFHYYFSYDNNRPTTKRILAKGIDFQSEGSYVVIPPSSIDGKDYTILRSAKIKSLPEWIYEKLDTYKETFELDEEFIPEGSRHNTLLSLAGYIRRKGVGYEPILALIKEFNLNHCTPPLPESQVVSMVKRIATYEPGNPLLNIDEEIVSQDAIKSEEIIISHILSGNYTNKELCLADIFTNLEVEYFINDRKQLIFKTARELWKQRVTPNLININSDLTKNKQHEIKKERFESYSYDDIKYHVKNIQHYRKNRLLTGIYKKALQRATKGLEPPSNIISDISSKTLPLLNDGRQETIFNTSQQIVLAREVYDRALLGEFILNEPTGYETLDNSIIGFPKSQVVILAGRPGHMKTNWLLNINRKMNELWRKKGEEGSSAIFSAEMNATQIAVRNIAAFGEFSQKDFRKGLVDVKIVEEATKKYKETQRCFIDTTPNPTGDYMITKAQALNQMSPLRIVFFDFIELTGETDDMMTLRLQKTTVKLKALAKLLDIPVIILSQTNRDLYNNRKIPIIPRDADLSWSDGLTKLADQIMFTIWHYKFSQELDYSEISDSVKDKNVIDLYISKNRDGQQDRITFGLLPECGKIIDPIHSTFDNKTDEVFK